MTDIAISAEDPRRPDVVAALRDLDAYLGALYPAESNHLLDVGSLAGPDMRFLVARRDGAFLGCVALRLDPDGYGEVKRLYVLPEARGIGVGRRLTAALETTARAEGLAWLRLETGIDQPEAIGLYRREGYRECEPFGDYRPDPLSLFMEKDL